MSEPEPAASHLRPIDIEADGLAKRVSVREIDEAHAHHEYEQVPHVAFTDEIAAVLSTFENLPEPFDDRRL